jgi:uncharacterized repeat protein (TIGR03803 family)
LITLEGGRPWGPLLESSDGTFYGTAINWSDFYVPRWGGIFKMTSQGVISSLYLFEAPVTGSGPVDGVVQGQDGNFYGVTYQGGEQGLGTVFEITPRGELTTLISFNRTNGAYPLASLTVGSDGNFYGTTSQGGLHGAGTIYRIVMKASLSIRRQRNEVVITWPATGVEYIFQSSTDLTSGGLWTNFADPSSAGSNGGAITNKLSERAHFFRLKQR